MSYDLSWMSLWIVVFVETIKCAQGDSVGQSSLGKVDFKECFVALRMISVRYPTRE
jgi:hypothetical protein